MVWMQNDTAMDDVATRDGRGSALVRGIPMRWRCDPLGSDDTDDEIVVTTNRRILRLAISAADVGARFAREESGIDPAAWMISPRQLFDGRTALDACQELIGFNRSVVLHGLGLALDADPDDVDELLDVREAAPKAAGDGITGSGAPHEPVLPRPCLLSCWIDVSEGGGRLFAFCAMVTDTPSDLVERVADRFGRAAADEAVYAMGFDHATPLATAMISDAMADTLALAASDPESPLAHGLDFVVEQRFLA